MRRFYARVQPRHRSGEMNKTEALYAEILELRRRAGEILEWAFEPEKLKLAKDCYYIPDFRVVKAAPWEGVIEFHEVKIRYKNGQIGWKGDAKEKFKIAQELHPYYFVVAVCDRGKWEFVEI